MEKILALLEQHGHNRHDLERDAYELSMDLPPAIAYFALDACRLHSPSTVSRWLCLPWPRPTGTGPGQGTPARLRFLAGLRRRSLKSRPDWSDNRFIWTNAINRAQHYAEKLL